MTSQAPFIILSQRGWNGHPVGRRAGSGTSPGSASGTIPEPSGCGIAAINAGVYGCWGARQTSRVGPDSTIKTPQDALTLGKKINWAASGPAASRCRAPP